MTFALTAGILIAIDGFAVFVLVFTSPTCQQVATALFDTSSRDPQSLKDGEENEEDGDTDDYKVDYQHDERQVLPSFKVKGRIREMHL